MNDSEDNHCNLWIIQLKIRIESRPCGGGGSDDDDGSSGCIKSVSYTHLDVYKRQVKRCHTRHFSRSPNWKKTSKT